ncbi:hypothetical protein [Streptacidiphilus albus]|uniref:hypothetical protein n=1 Tax=Streptacidiphilus albus TaxID=105425 RepID=UPI000A875EEF|nr:hypothetical protein [Streptacidiphilus albus]
MVARTWLRLAVPAVLLAFGAAGCTSDNTGQLNAWATSLCQGMQSPIQQANTALADTGAVKTGESPQALQTRLATDLGTLATANTQIAQAVQQAGMPKVDNGAQLQANAVAELKKAATGYTNVQQAVTALSVADQAKFAANLKGIGDQVQQLAELSTSALTQLQTGDLGTALAKQPGCSSVNASPTAGATDGSGAAPVPSGSTAGSSTASGKAGSDASAAGKPSPSASAH